MNPLLSDRAFKDFVFHICQSINQYGNNSFQNCARFSIWNSIFIDDPVTLSTTVHDHFNNIFRRHLIGSTSAQRFLFELAVFMIDLPEQYLQLLNVFPIPYSIAGKIAYRAVIDSIEPTLKSAEQELVEAVELYVPNPPDYIRMLLDKHNNKVEIFKLYAPTIEEKLPHEIIEAIIRCFPKQERIKYSIMYQATPPSLKLDLSDIMLPYEFLQALTDIEGPDQANELIEQ